MTERVVVVGGGTAVSVLANNLADEVAAEIDAGDVEVVLVNDREEHVYKPTWLYVPFGEKTPEDAKRPLDDLIDRRVDLLIDRVSAVDTDAETVSFEGSRSDLAYDHVVLAMGAQVTPEETPGLAEGGHHFYGPEATEELRQELAEFTEGHLVMSVVGVPHMCPVAPLEFTFMADDWLRERGLREDVEITYTYPVGQVHGNPHIAEWARPVLDDRDINVETFFNAESVDPEAKTMTSMEGTELDYDLLVSIPPHRGIDVIEEAGLGEKGWVDVDSYTLEAEAAEDVYALGDTATTGAPKSGSVAHYQVSTVGQRLSSRIRGRPATATYDGKTLCFIETGMDEATFVAFDYENAPSPPQPSEKIHWSKLAYNESYWLTARGLL